MIRIGKAPNCLFCSSTGLVNGPDVLGEMRGLFEVLIAEVTRVWSHIVMNVRNVTTQTITETEALAAVWIRASLRLLFMMDRADVLFQISWRERKNWR